jgi:hypothetical protein
LSHVVFNLIDSHPLKKGRWRDADVLSIDGDPRKPRAKPEIDKLNAFIEALPTRKQIVHLYVERDSRLTELPDLSLLPNVTELTVSCLGIKSFEALERVKALDSLVIARYPADDYSGLKHLKPDWLQLGRCAPGRFELSCTTALLQSYAKLESFGPCRVRNLVLDACHNVALETLSAVRGLRQLQLLGCRFDSLEFVARCRGLKQLVITATSYTKLDLAPVLEQKGLKSLFLSAKDSVIEQLGKRAPRLVVTNGEFCFYRNRSVDPQEMYYSKEEVR